VFQLASSMRYTSKFHFNVYIDNNCVSQQLIIMIRDLDISTCSTVQVNISAFPPDLKDKRKNILWNKVCGESADAEGKVLGLQWQDNYSVHFLSTIHLLEEQNISEHKKSQSSSSNSTAIHCVFSSHVRVNIPIPTITDNYNHYKVGVDVMDQYCSYYFT